MAKQIPESAQVVIIGGGIVGASIAYHRYVCINRFPAQYQVANHPADNVNALNLRNSFRKFPAQIKYLLVLDRGFG